MIRMKMELKWIYVAWGWGVISIYVWQKREGAETEKCGPLKSFFMTPSIFKLVVIIIIIISPSTASIVGGGGPEGRRNRL